VIEPRKSLALLAITVGPMCEEQSRLDCNCPRKFVGVDGLVS
jgi:hypothetical protein